MNAGTARSKTGPLSGFTLTETLVAIALAGPMLLALYGCFAWGFTNVQVTRENLRATQILLKRLETVRLCNFTQLTDPSYNPANFTDYYDPKDQPTGGGGTVYTGTYSAATPASGTLPDSYRTNMLLITVGVTWNSAKVQHSRTMQTYVAQNGIDGYVATGH
jgi:prepilin-type N-terminal cleavage/methylation domain-containing protein